MLKEYFEKFGEIIEVVRVMLWGVQVVVSPPLGFYCFYNDIIPSVDMYRSLCEIE